MCVQWNLYIIINSTVICYIMVYVRHTLHARIYMATLSLYTYVHYFHACTCFNQLIIAFILLVLLAMAASFPACIVSTDTLLGFPQPLGLWEQRPILLDLLRFCPRFEILVWGLFAYNQLLKEKCIMYIHTCIRMCIKYVYTHIDVFCLCVCV